MFVGADSAHGQELISLVFNQFALAPTALFNNCALLFVRPHAGQFQGEIVDTLLQANFEISAMYFLRTDFFSLMKFDFGVVQI